MISHTDFDECINVRYHDCSENAYCFNLRGTYTCSCRDGFVDLSENPVYPGRVCSAELMGCDRCNYHGACTEHERADNYDEIEMVCECFQWYAGEKCQYNLKGMHLWNDFFQFFFSGINFNFSFSYSFPCWSYRTWRNIVCIIIDLYNIDLLET